MSNCQVRLDITVGDELKREKLNTKDGRILITRTGNRPSPAVTQGGFSKGDRHPPALVVSPAHVGYVIAKVLVVAWRRFSCRPINYKFGCTFFLHSRPYCGFRLITYCTLFAYLKNHCLFAMASRLQCEAIVPDLGKYENILTIQSIL